MKLTIRQAAIQLGISPQALYERIASAGIVPVKDKLTGWRMLTAAQMKRLKGNEK